MGVRLYRKGIALDERGKLPVIIYRNGRDYRVVTIIAKFVYKEASQGHTLLRIIVACIPSKELQSDYNPTANKTVWRVGRDAPTLGEDFRVRLNYVELRKKS